MKYRNKITGAVISTEDRINGKGWELVTVSNPKPVVEEPEKEKQAPQTKKKGKKQNGKFCDCTGSY